MRPSCTAWHATVPPAGGAPLHGSVFGTARAGDAGIVTFDQCGAAIPYHAARMVGGDLAIHFDKSAETRRAMIAKLFTGDYTNEIQQISPLRVLGRLAHKILD